MIAMSFRRAFILSLIGFLFLPSSANARQFGNWTVKSGKNYLVAEQISQCTQGFKQRVDFTYSIHKGWQFTFTTRFIADSVSILIDGKRFDFEGEKSFHKMSWPVERELVDLVANTIQPILIIEQYTN
ncbi:hypothetical protein ACVD1N_21925 [Vibrio parahaemolyticus]|nr:hypothetical protein [Vibrio parahaemolyticus]EKH9203392.1 hypothetical protein [Vibrio parahaemolyticus]